MLGLKLLLKKHSTDRILYVFEITFKYLKEFLELANRHHTLFLHTHKFCLHPDKYVPCLVLLIIKQDIYNYESNLSFLILSDWIVNKLVN